jgi:hypothetical protein
MKIVREHLNEIVRGATGSGWGTLGVGHNFESGLATAKREIPFVISGCKPMSEVFADSIYDDLRKIIERRGKFLFKDMLWIDENKEAYNFRVERMIRDWSDQWNFSTTIFKVGGAEWADRLTLCKFDEIARVGKLIVKGHDIFENIRGYFVENK